MTTPLSGSPTSNSGASRQATLRELFAVLFRRRWIVLGLVLTVTTTVVLIMLLTPTTYLSSGKVLVSRGERESALSSHLNITNDWEQDLAGEVAKARSAEVMDRTRKLLEARARKSGRAPAPFSPASVEIEVMGRSNVLAIGYSDRAPDVAQEVCDALLTAYVDYRTAQGIVATDPMFQQEMARLQAQISAKTAARESVSAHAGSVDPAELSRQLNDQLGVLEERRNETEAELSDAQSSLRAMKDLREHPDIDLPTIQGQFTNEAALVRLKEKITDQQAHVALLRERYRDDSPEVQNALGTLSTLQALLRREVDSRLTVAQSRISILQSRLDVHRRDIADLKSQINAVPMNQKLVDDLSSEIRTLRQRFEDYGRARDQAHIASNTATGVTITLLNPAGPAEPKNARDYVRLALAPAFSVVVGIGLAFFIDGLDPTVRTPVQAEEYLDLPVLATLPERRKTRG